MSFGNGSERLEVEEVGDVERDFSNKGLSYGKKASNHKIRSLLRSRLVLGLLVSLLFLASNAVIWKLGENYGYNKFEREIVYGIAEVSDGENSRAGKFILARNHNAQVSILLHRAPFWSTETKTIPDATEKQESAAGQKRRAQ